MTSFYNGVPHSSTVSEVSSAPPSPVSSNPIAPGNATRFGMLVPNRVFVGGIASNTTESELQELFSQFGNIKEIKIISDKGGVCKGYGFVTFETEEEARKVQHQPDSIVLKERRLNIAPAVMKQQPFGRPPYDVAPSPGAMLYHNGTTYTYQNGMAFFTAQQPPQAAYPTRETAIYTAPFGPGQASSNPTFPQLMYAPYSQPMPYLTPGQQYQYPMPFDYFKAVGPSSPYVYATPPGAMNGALNSAMNGGLGNASQSPSPGYCQPSGSPAGNEIYYNGVHPPALPITQHQPMYPVESSPAHSEDWNTELRQTHTPVVSLLKLRDEGSVEEMEIKRTPKKSFPSGSSGPAGPRLRSRRPGRPGPSPSQGRVSSRGGGAASPGVDLAGQQSASSPYLSSSPNSCLHHSTSLSPSDQVPSNYNGSRSSHPQVQQPPYNLLTYQSRRGGGSGMRGCGPKTYLGHSRNDSSHHNNTSSRNSSPNQILSNVPSSGHSSSKTSPKLLGDTVNGVKSNSSSAPCVSAGNSAVQKKRKDFRTRWSWRSSLTPFTSQYSTASRKFCMHCCGFG